MVQGMIMLRVVIRKITLSLGGYRFSGQIIITWCATNKGDMENGDGSYDFRQFSEWSEDDVVCWMRGLGDAVSEHAPQFLAHCICGEDLLKLNRQKLEYLQVTQIGHQELFLEAVELLSRLDKSLNQQSFVTLGAMLSKKASQLLRLLSDGDNSVDATHLESSAAMMSAAKVLISSLDRNPTSIIEDYESFRDLVLRNSLQITAALSEAPEYDKNQLTEMVMMIVKATSVLISPNILSGNQTLELIKVVLIPDNKYGLGISMEKTGSGVLLITNIQPGSPADLNGRICVGDEVVQVNQQNVIGWELSYVIECLKASEFQVSLILKPGVGLGSPKIHQNGSNQQRHYSNGSEVSSHSEPQDYIQPLSIQDAADIAQEGHENRTFSSPLSDASSHSTDGEKPVQVRVMKGLPRNFFIPPPPKESYEEFIHNSESDSGKATPDSGNLHSSSLAVDSAIDLSDKERSLSDFEPEHDYVEPPMDVEPEPKKPSQKQKMPNISYKTQIVGGVVHRIPITAGAVIEGEPSLGPESPKLSRGSIRNKKKPPPKSKQQGGGLLATTDAAMVSAQKSDAFGELSKQDQIEGPRSGSKKHKKSDPALKTACFQITDIEHEGWLTKQGGSGFTPKNWRRRWMVLKERKLYYYKTSFDVSALGVIDLPGYVIEDCLTIRKPNAFMATKPGCRTYYFYADTSEEMIRWIQVLRESAIGEKETIKS